MEGEADNVVENIVYKEASSYKMTRGSKRAALVMGTNIPHSLSPFQREASPFPGTPYRPFSVGLYL